MGLGQWPDSRQLLDSVQRPACVDWQVLAEDHVLQCCMRYPVQSKRQLPDLPAIGRNADVVLAHCVPLDHLHRVRWCCLLQMLQYQQMQHDTVPRLSS